MEKSRLYEALFIISPEKEDILSEITGDIKSVIGENSGKVTKENVVGKKKLAYPIKKKSEGLYYEVSFEADPLGITKMQRLFRINTNLLRTLIDKA